MPILKDRELHTRYIRWSGNAAGQICRDERRERGDKRGKERKRGKKKRTRGKRTKGVGGRKKRRRTPERRPAREGEICSYFPSPGGLRFSLFVGPCSSTVSPSRLGTDCQLSFENVSMAKLSMANWAAARGCSVKMALRRTCPGPWAENVGWV